MTALLAAGMQVLTSIVFKHVFHHCLLRFGKYFIHAFFKEALSLGFLQRDHSGHQLCLYHDIQILFYTRIYLPTPPFIPIVKVENLLYY